MTGREAKFLLHDKNLGVQKTKQNAYSDMVTIVTDKNIV